ncbi:DUF1206 domain-containing protein [Chthonobacter rhizosphaerae]|uniref:DUF1206 domain-containing protein n=1 Tax=Chthonobacter rhizosphaerae TaxID=2735553 RepID=UPI0015EECEE8|nr:DUF1206 domain-containing protein [Chthonobacter rhizosphaerae]
MEMLARGGYAARGVVYAIVGYFAVIAAIGSGETKDTEDTLSVVLGGPFGTVLVGVLAIGLLGYAIWRFIQATADPDHFGTDAKGLAIRAGFLIAAVTYAGLAVTAAGAALGMALGGGGGGTAEMQRQAVGFLGGRVVAGLLAAIFIGVAIAHVVKAVRCTYERYLNADAETRDRIRPIARAGLIARAVVFLVIGGLMALRAWTASGTTEQPPTLKDVLTTVQTMPAGTWILLVIGIGFVAFAIYSFVEAVYRRINVETPPIPGANAVRNAARMG